MPKGIYKRTEIHKRNIGFSMKGKKPWITGKHHSQESKERMRKKALLQNRKPPVNTGEKHGRWKNGVSKYRLLVDQIRRSRKYFLWRLAVFNRDNFSCVVCKDNKGGNLQADHYPKTLAEFIYNFNIKTLEDAYLCKELWKINIARTLCRDCHKKTITWGKHYLVSQAAT